jgi:hypothetical protein
MTTIGPAVGSDIVLTSAEAADHRPRGPPHCAPPEPHAQLIIALDYSHWFPLQRLLRRTITRLFDHREICNGYRESLRGFFSRDAIIVWHVKSFKRKR